MTALGRKAPKIKTHEHSTGTTPTGESTTDGALESYEERPRAVLKPFQGAAKRVQEKAHLLY